jgi:hypothetical protein
MSLHSAVNYLPQLAWLHDPPVLSLLSREDYNHEPQHSFSYSPLLCEVMQCIQASNTWLDLTAGTYEMSV